MSTTIPAAISGFLAQLENASIEGVTIFDGPPLANAKEWVAVGYQPEQNESVAGIEWDWAQIGAQRTEESYDILCCLGTASGSTEMSVGRLRASAIRDAVAAAISADRTLGGAVRLSRMSSGVLLQEQTSRGRIVGFLFTVHCEARITT